MKHDRMFHVIVLSGIGLVACGGVQDGTLTDGSAEGSGDGFPVEGPPPPNDAAIDRFPSETKSLDSATDTFPTEGPILLDGSADRFPSESDSADASTDSFPTEGPIIKDGGGGVLDAFPKEAPAP
jgi:hypothetical protein